VIRWLATLGILALLALDALLPYTAIGSRGPEAVVRRHVPEAASWVGRPLPDLRFEDLAGSEVGVSDFRGRPFLLILERSVDW
jgi:hypothetical protein